MLALPVAVHTHQFELVSRDKIELKAAPYLPRRSDVDWRCISDSHLSSGQRYREQNQLGQALLMSPYVPIWECIGVLSLQHGTALAVLQHIT